MTHLSVGDRQHAADNARMRWLIHHARWALVALVSAAATAVSISAKAGDSAPAPAQTQVHAVDDLRVTLDVHPTAVPPRGAAILSHGFSRS